MNTSSSWIVLSLMAVLGACSSRVSKPVPTQTEDVSVSALNKNNNRELFLNRVLSERAADVQSLKPSELRVRETSFDAIENAEGTFALVSFVDDKAQAVGEHWVYYFAKDRSALKIDEMPAGLEFFLEQTGPQNAKLATSFQNSDDEGITEIFLLTPYSARVISNKTYNLSQARDKAEFNRFRRSWKESTLTWSCRISGQPARCSR